MDQALIESTIARLLDARASTSSICPSEAAKALAPNDWRRLMDEVREAAAHMAERGDLRITQGESTVDPDAVLAKQVRGPIRLRRG